MRRVLAATCFHLAVTLPGVGEAGSVLTGLAAPSPALGRPLAYSLYLPDGAADLQGRLPAVYLLHGHDGSDAQWREDGAIATILDAMIALGELPPLLAVMPAAGNGWYVNSAALGGPGDVETALVRDLVAHIEIAHGAAPRRSGRAIAGVSMGGYGALRLAFFHPDRFAAVASLAGAIYPRLEAPAEGGRGGDDAAAIASWYKGAFGTPPDPAVYRTRNPFTAVATLAARPDPPAIWLAAGDDDFFALHRGAVTLFDALRDAGVPAELRIEDGGHDFGLWRRQTPAMLRFLAAQLDGPRR